MRAKPFSYGIAVEPEHDRFKVTRHGHRYYITSFGTERRARQWAEKAVIECAIDPLSGVHFAAAHVRRAALAGWRKVHVHE